MDADLFLVPFLAGLCLALLLPVLGCYLRLHDEWLAALSYSHVAAGGALLAMLAGVPAPAGGLLAAATAALAKRPLATRLGQASVFPLLLLAGWAAGMLVAANHPLAERVGSALFDGQLYFADIPRLLWLLAASCGGLLLLRRLSRGLLLSRLYPDHFRLRGEAAWPLQGGFDLLAALLLALATTTLGVMATFALVFVPPWLTFRRAGGWRRGLRLTVLIGAAIYLVAFVAALALDQPFGPLLGLAAVAACILGGRRGH